MIKKKIRLSLKNNKIIEINSPTRMANKEGAKVLTCVCLASKYKTNSFDCWFDRAVSDVGDDQISRPAITCQTSAVQTRSDFLTDAKRHFIIKITNLTKKAKGSHYENDICRTGSEPHFEIFNILLKVSSRRDSRVSEERF